MGHDIHKSIEKTDKTSQEIVDLSINVITLLNESKDQESALLVRSTLFLSLAIRDEVAAIQAYKKGANKWSRIYQLRGAILQMFEIGDDLPNVFGKDFRKACANIKCPSETTKTYIDNLKKLNKFRSNNENYFKNIRQAAVAHRDHNPIEMLDRIKMIDQKKTFNLLVSHLKLMNTFQKSLMPILRVIIKNKERTIEQLEVAQGTVQSLLVKISKLHTS